MIPNHHARKKIANATKSVVEKGRAWISPHPLARVRKESTWLCAGLVCASASVRGLQPARERMNTRRSWFFLQALQANGGKFAIYFRI